MDLRLVVLALGAFAGTMESAVLPGLLPAIGADLGVGVGQAGLMVFAYSVVYAVTAPLMSSLFGGLDRRLTLTIAEVGFGLCALGIALAPGFEVAVGARAALAAMAVLFTSTAQATAYAISPPERRGRSVATVLTGATIAVAIGAPVGALIGITFGWRLTFGIVAALAIASGIVMAARMPSGLSGEQISLRERVQVLREPGVALALFVSLVFALGLFTPGIYFAAITAGPMGMGQGGIPVVMFAAGIGAVLGGAVGGQVMDRLGVYRSVVLFMSLSGVVLALMSLITLLPAPVIPALWVLLYGIISFIGWALYSAQVGLLSGLAPQAVTLAISLNLSASNIGGAASALMGGYIAEHVGPGAIGGVSAVLVAISVALLVLNRRTLARAG